MKRFCSRILNDEDGQDLIEYSLLAALISILAVVAITGLGAHLSGRYQNIHASIP